MRLYENNDFILKQFKDNKTVLIKNYIASLSILIVFSNSFVKIYLYLNSADSILKYQNLNLLFFFLNYF